MASIAICRARSSAIHRQADRTGAELCRPGRDRHREHAAAQRAAQNRCSSRPPPPTCSRSSAAQPSIYRRLRYIGGISGVDLCEAERCATFFASRRADAAGRVPRFNAGPEIPWTEYDRNQSARAAQYRRPRRAGATHGAYSRIFRPIPNTALSRPRRRPDIRTTLGGSAASRRATTDWASPLSAEVKPFTEKQIDAGDDFRRPGGDRDRERSTCSKALKLAPANWRSRWRTCAPRRTAWCRPRSSPRLAN